MSTPINNSVSSPSQNPINSNAELNALKAQYLESTSTSTTTTQADILAAAAGGGAQGAATAAATAATQGAVNAVNASQAAQYVDPASNTTTQVSAGNGAGIQAQQAQVNASVLTSNLSNLDPDKSAAHDRRNLANNVNRI